MSRLPELEAQMRRTASELRRLQRAAARQDRIPPGLWATACLVHWSADGGLEPALRFLVHSRPSVASQRATLATKLEDTRSGTPGPERLRQLGAPSTAAERSRLARALKWLHEDSLHSWVGALNLKRGIAPMSSVMLREMENRVAQGAPRLTVAAARRGRLQWLRRWRGRWGIRLARIVAGDRLPVRECCRKAARLATTRIEDFGVKVGPSAGGGPGGERGRLGGTPGNPGPKMGVTL